MSAFYRVNEIFFSMQGEGLGMGDPTVFVRFSGCNLDCSFCDTPHHEYREFSAHFIIEEAIRVSEPMGPNLRPNITFTGGEPLMQLDRSLMDAAERAGFQTRIETNGAQLGALRALGDISGLMPRLDQITVSPKNMNLNIDVMVRANCLKVIWPLPGALRPADIDDLVKMTPGAQMRVLQPRTPAQLVPGNKDTWHEFQGNCQWAWSFAVQELRTKNRLWHVLPQMHALMGFR